MSEKFYRQLGKETLVKLYLSAKKKADAYDKLRQIIRDMVNENNE